MLLLLAGMWIWLIGPGYLAGQMFPAASPMVLSDAHPSGDRTVFAGSSERLRPGCSFRDIEWFLGTRDGQHVPADIYVGPPQVKDNGVFEFVGWSVDVVPVSMFRDFTFADVIHKCRILYRLKDTDGDGDTEAVGGIELPWMTRSRFFN